MPRNCRRCRRVEVEDEPAQFEQPWCPACGGDGGLLGQLGNRIHFRCRACGMDFSMRYEVHSIHADGAR